MRTFRLPFAVLLWLLMALASAAAQAQALRAGQVSQLQGMATAQQPDGSVRFLAQGDAVLEGDTLTTTDRGYAVISLLDGTKYTLRPSTTFTVERFAHDQGSETLWVRLVKGGVRAVSGLIGKRNPGGVELRTPTATVGIRGTSFDARLCGDDCRSEESAQAGVSTPTPPPPVAARVVQLTGSVQAQSVEGATRPLSAGSALFEGETVRAGADATAVLGFRDHSLVSLNPGAVLRINAFSYQQPDKPDNIALRLVRGGIRAFTGLIGHRVPEAVKIQTVSSTVGIRGTGMDISCKGICAEDGEAGGPPPASPSGGGARPEDGLFMLTWDGVPYFERGPLDVPLDRVGFIGADGLPQILQTVPEFMRNFAAPRPDRVPVDWNQLFAAIDPQGGNGLYVYVREGQVNVRSGDSIVELAPGEAAWSGQTGQARRISPVPNFLRLDPTPIPELSTGSNGPLLQLFGVRLGQPGQEICRL